MPDSSIELVVAHYHESLNWLRKVPTAITKTIYSKAETPLEIPHLTLPNVGREAHTYLHHLTTRYDSLADYTVFCQGKPFDHAYDFHHKLRSFASGELPEASFKWLGHIIDTDTADGQLYQDWSKNTTGEGLNLGLFHQELFGAPGPTAYPFVLGAQFIIRRDLVQRQPLEFYESALALTTTFPQSAHCYERMWDRVFGVTGIDLAWLAGRRTVFLKKIKEKA